MPKLSYITRRIASRTHILQIEALRRADGAAARVEREVNAAAAKAITAILTTDTAFDLLKIRKVLDDLWREVAETMYRSLEAMTNWSREQAADAIVSTVPRKWFRALVPALPAKVSEAETQVFGGGAMIPPTVFVASPAPAPNEGDPCNPLLPPPPGYLCIGGLLVRIEDEPVRAGTMTGKQRDAAIKKMVFPPLRKDRLNQIVFGPDRGGASWLQRIQALNRQVAQPDALAGQLVQGLSGGENVQQLTSRIKDQFSLAASSAKRIARTEAKRVSLHAQSDSFNALGPLLIGYQHNAQLDQNTRPHHAALAGKVYYLNPKPGQDSVDDMIIPPGQDPEPNCRCWSSPVLSPPEDIESNPALNAEFENAAKEEIPDPTVYDQWFSRADEGSRKEAVGARRYAAMKDVLGDQSRPEWTDFVDTDGRLLSPAELRDESPEGRFRRKAAVSQMFREREAAIRSVAQTGFLAQ